MMSKKSPQLRFEGFTDDWEERKLSDVTFEHLTKDKISEIAKKVANEIKNINHHDDNFPPAYS